MLLQSMQHRAPTTANIQNSFAGLHAQVSENVLMFNTLCLFQR